MDRMNMCRIFGIAMLLVLDEAAEVMPEEGTHCGDSAEWWHHCREGSVGS
jgi:hypothetical protein